MSLKSFIMSTLLLAVASMYMHKNYPEYTYLLLVVPLGLGIISIFIMVIRMFHSHKNKNPKFEKEYSEVPSHVVSSGTDLEGIFKIQKLEETLSEDLVEAYKEPRRPKFDL